MTRERAKELDTRHQRYGYGTGVPCLVCGQMTDSLALRCERCLEAICHGEELQFAERWLQAHPEMLIEIGWDRKRRMHLVLLRAPANAAWCGEHVSQKKETRKAVKRGEFPPGICEQCLEVYEGLRI